MAPKHIKAMLEDIFLASRVWRRGFGRRGEGRGWEEVAESESGIEGS